MKLNWFNEREKEVMDDIQSRLHKEGKDYYKLPKKE